MTTSATRLLCVLGHPVAHSVSPQIHTAALAAAGVDAVYVAIDVAPEEFATVVTGLVAAGFGGANVTVPHKQAALALAQRATTEAQAIGAANTLYLDDGVLVADNTDAGGLGTVLDDVGLDAGDCAVVVGAGGMARAAAVALGRAGARVRIWARRPQQAAEVSAVAAAAGAILADDDERPRLIVNATPLGLHGESLPEQWMTFGSDQIAIDCVYAPTDTPFVAAARHSGAHAVDGSGLLVAQAALSFRRWIGMDPDRAVMEAAARIALHRG